ncbi:MAG: tyrosine--tRNA ligase [Acidimicrobiales bacterium]
MTGSAHVLDDLEARGLVQDHTDRDALHEALGAGPVVLYAGFDPTADSLHLGNLVPLLVLRRFQDFGHRPIVLAGGATGMVGDPGGRSDERNLLDPEALRANTAAIKVQLAQFLAFDGEAAAILVDNRDWTEGVTLLDFLRDVGKHVTVNQMTAKDSVRNRLESETGISFTEFSYMLLQAHDYWWLYTNHDCVLQLGGSDQWGNITAGIDLIRRKEAATVHGLTVPLMTRADGAKFGKSQDGSIWLDPAKTSPYQFFQYLVQMGDRDAERFLLQLTLLPVERCAEIVAEHQQAPERRLAQRELARALTTLVHGEAASSGAEQASAVLFGGPVDGLDEAGFEVLAAEVPTVDLEPGELGAGVELVDAMVRGGLATSKGDARRTIEQGGVYVAGAQTRDVERKLSGGDAVGGRYVLLRRGKANHLLLREAG